MVVPVGRVIRLLHPIAPFQAQERIFVSVRLQVTAAPPDPRRCLRASIDPVLYLSIRYYSLLLLMCL
jgi:hypothetical protein